MTGVQTCALPIYELDDDGQMRLLECLRSLKGMVILSGYDSEMYREGLPGWTVIRRSVQDSARRERVECLWLNRAAALAVESSPSLFDVA